MEKIDRKEWEAFQKWKQNKNDRERSELDSKPTETERDNGNNQRSDTAEDTNRTEPKTEGVDFEFKPSKTEVQEKYLEEVVCAKCGYTGKYEIDKYPDVCPVCGEQWR